MVPLNQSLRDKWLSLRRRKRVKHRISKRFWETMCIWRNIFPTDKSRRVAETRLKFNLDASSDRECSLSNKLQSENGMPLQRFRNVGETCRRTRCLFMLEMAQDLSRYRGLHGQDIHRCSVICQNYYCSNHHSFLFFA